MSAKSESLYRPYLTSEEVLYLLELVIAAPPTQLELKLKKKLMKFKFSIAQSILSPSYVTTRDSVEVKLGLEGEDKPDAAAYKKKLESIPALLMSPEERYNFLANKVVAEEEELTVEEAEEGKQLELQLYGMSMGMFD
jgi:hypothetical protein